MARLVLRGCAFVDCRQILPYTSSGGLNAKVKIANYSGKSLDGRRLEWTLVNKSGRMPIPAGEGLIDVGDIDIDLADIHAPAQLTPCGLLYRARIIAPIPPVGLS